MYNTFIMKKNDLTSDGMYSTNPSSPVCVSRMARIPLTRPTLMIYSLQLIIPHQQQNIDLQLNYFNRNLKYSHKTVPS